LLRRGGARIINKNISKNPLRVNTFKCGIADPVRDIEILKIAREDAFAILEKDEDLTESENKVIAEVLRRAPPFNEISL
jgi:predicted nuclease of predicted toxin-antitoxin system